MSSWNHSFAADEHTSYTTRQGVDQASPIESAYTDGSTYTDGCTYPDPTGFGRQTPPTGPDALPKSSHHYGPYFQTANSNANEVQADDPFEGDEFWSKQSWDPDYEQYLADLDPFPEATQISAIQPDPQGESQLSTGAVGQTREVFPLTALTFRQTNTPAQSTNTGASDIIYSVGHPVGYAPSYIPCTATFPSQPFGGTSPYIPVVSSPYTPYIPVISSPYTNSPATQTARQNFRPLNTCFGNPEDEIAENRGLDKCDRGSQLSAKKRKQQSRKRAVVAGPIRRSRRTNQARETATFAEGSSGPSSVLGRRKAELGAAMGSDYRLRERVKVENGRLFGLVDNQWTPAGYHVDFRARLILKDAQQPGAPAPPPFSPVIPPNYTSYSPITQGWNDDDLMSMTDSQGRHAFLMPMSPPDWVHNPPTGYLMCDGLVMLDHNNRPIKDYPGAPLTLSHDAPPSLIEGLRRYFGMTYFDMTGRMAPERHTSTGIRPVIGSTLLSSRVGRWIKSHKDNGMRPWIARGW